MTRAEFLPALRLLFVLTLLTGIVYPLALIGFAQLVFPSSANGSIIESGGMAVGSELIGQSFQSEGYFWSRPSTTSPFPYNAAASSGSNLGPSSATLHGALRERVEALRRADPNNQDQVPIDLVTASASGLDPHVSVAAARYQAARIARIRGIPEATLLALIDEHTSGRTLGFLGEPRVNVLTLNLALDDLAGED